MIISGQAFVFGDDINTDEIIPARYLNTTDPAVLARYCMEDIRPGFGQRDDIRGSILVAGKNFGCGSSREHAPLSIKSAGIQAVIAQSFARIFLRNAINIGLPIVEISDIGTIREGDKIEIRLQEGKIINLTRDYTGPIHSYPEFLQKIIQCGGWLEYARTVYQNQ